MLSRFAGRLVTGPLAFFVAGAIDLVVFGAGALLRRSKHGKAGRWRLQRRSRTTVGAPR
jgi:hypothetical protein